MRALSSNAHALGGASEMPRVAAAGGLNLPACVVDNQHLIRCSADNTEGEALGASI